MHLCHFFDGPEALNFGVEKVRVPGVPQSTVGFRCEGVKFSNALSFSRWARACFAPGGGFRSFICLVPVDRGMKGSGRAGFRYSPPGGGQRVEEDVWGKALCCFLCMVW